jgi:hypothetical protein
MECQKLVYQPCSRLRAALGSSLIIDTLDSFLLMVLMMMGLIMIFVTFLFEEVFSFGNINLGIMIKLGLY